MDLLQLVAPLQTLRLQPRIIRLSESPESLHSASQRRAFERDNFYLVRYDLLNRFIVFFYFQMAGTRASVPPGPSGQGDSVTVAAATSTSTAPATETAAAAKKRREVMQAQLDEKLLEARADEVRALRLENATRLRRAEEMAAASSQGV